MELVTPDIGLLFWMTLSFLIVLFLLTKFAWKPINQMLKERDKSIEDALAQAEKAKAEMTKLNADNERLIREAQQERDNILKAAREAKEQMISEAKGKAKEEADKLVASARESIENERKAAITDIKNQVALLSMEIAEKLIKKELSTDAGQKELTGKLIGEIKLN
jgi:F-type H+-transporting ATPase subunit b